MVWTDRDEYAGTAASGDGRIAKRRVYQTSNTAEWDMKRKIRPADPAWRKHNDG
jgi:hypothetical protein